MTAPVVRALAQALALAGLLAASPAPAQDGLKLDGPHMYRVNQRALALTPGDFNGDGLTDFAVALNDLAVLRVFEQLAEPGEDGARFREVNITLDRICHKLRAMDVDGDGRTDLVAACTPSQLAVMYQSREGRLQPPVSTDLRADFLAVGDLNGDDRADLLVVSEKRVDILRGGRRGLKLEPAATFFTTSNLLTNPWIVDLNGDGRRDILLAPGDKRDTLLVRLQSPAGDFPSEAVVKPGVLRWADGVARSGREDLVAAIHNQTRELMMLRLSDAAAPRSDSALAFSLPSYVAFDPERVSTSRGVSVATDLDGDGRRDLVTAIPELAALRVVRQTRNGGLHPAVIPSLSGISTILPWETSGGKATALLLLSKTENVVAVARPDAEKPGELVFPKPLPTSQRPLAMARAALAGTKGHALVLCERAEGERIELVAHAGFDPMKDATGERRVLATIEPARAKGVASLFAHDLDGNGTDDIVVVPEFGDPIVLLQDDKGAFTRREAAGVLASLLSTAREGGLRTARLADSGETVHALAVRQDYVRAFTLDPAGEPVIAAQFNGRNGRSRIVSATQANLRGPDSREVALLDTGNKVLTLYGHDESTGRHDVLRHVDIDDAGFTEVHALDLDGDSRDELLLLAPDRVAVLSTKSPVGGFETLETVKTEVRDGGFNMVVAEDITGTADPEVIVLEARENQLEFHGLAAKRNSPTLLERLLRFRVFEGEATANRRVNMDAAPEPREIRTADLDGDGMQDLLVLVHDYVIVYYQRKAEE